MQSQSPGVPFPFFSSLIREIAKIRPIPAKLHGSWTRRSYPARQVFENWVRALRKQFSPLPPNTTAICFRLLFPEEDIRRKYDIQETKMTTLLAACLGINSNTFAKWSLQEASGCLGQELKVVMERTCTETDGATSPFTIADVDQLLDELAAKSPYSHASVRVRYPKATRRRRQAILQQFLRNMSPEDASILIQIILKDLRPLLYPLTEFHYSAALTKFNTLSVKMLTKEHALHVWDPSGSAMRAYRMRPSLDEVAAFLDLPPKLRPNIEPQIGSFIEMPKSEKAISCLNALQYLSNSSIVWAETKYDGERAQIHLEVHEDSSARITIFSKSKRDSTHDRRAIHEIIRSSLGLAPTSRSKPKIRANIVLDAEMVAYRGGKVEEFWRIRRLIEDTAYGVRGSKNFSKAPEDDDEYESMKSTVNEGFNLALVFFDVLIIDSELLLNRPYSYRRQRLENLIILDPGKAMLAERFRIDMKCDHPETTLRRIFIDHIVDHQEGLILKGDESQYNDFDMPWVKLKKDYIPGHGDSVDLAIIGASWEKARGRSLRVPPTTYTTFYIGVPRRTSTVPHFHVYFTASYGLSRDRLEELNFLVKATDPLEYPFTQPPILPFTFTVFKALKPPPTVILRTPLLVELFGAGFTKAPQNQYYELRFPRIMKVHRPSERNWAEAVDLTKLHEIARESVGRDRSTKDLDDWCNQLWGKPTSPSVTSSLKRKATVEFWEQTLSRLEKIARRNPTSPCKATHNHKLISDRQSDVLHDQPLAEKPEVPSNLSIFSRDHDGRESTRVLGSHPEDSLVWFAQSKCEAGSCPQWTLWKNGIPRERRLHSLESLLTGCGWDPIDPTAAPVARQGIIIFDECVSSGKQWETNILDKLKSLSGVGVPIWCYSCTRLVYKLE